jgi:hypothetical protein
LYAIAGILQLFHDIVESSRNKNKISIKQFTGYVIDKMIDANDQTTSINNKYVSKMTSERFETLYNSKALIDIAPSVYGGSEDRLRRFEYDTSVNDHGRHNHGIKKIVYATKMKKIICMDNVPHGLSVYDRQGVVTHQVVLSTKRHSSDARIVAFTYSHKEKRIGATNNDYTITFWDFSDNFKYEKSYNYDSENLRDQIYYIEFCSRWLTVDQTHKIHIIDIENLENSELLTEVGR